MCVKTRKPKTAGTSKIKTSPEDPGKIPVAAICDPDCWLAASEQFPVIQPVNSGIAYFVIQHFSPTQKVIVQEFRSTSLI